MVYDWEFKNPYYESVDKSKFKLHFFENALDIVDESNESFQGVISHYSPKQFALKFNDEIRKDSFPIICYRETNEAFQSAQDFFDKLNLPKENLYCAENPNELSDLLEKIFK